eukprot:scaffold442_cov110-Cylindrotheca_fusiformis.AAC.4
MSSEFKMLLISTPVPDPTHQLGVDGSTMSISKSFAVKALGHRGCPPSRIHWKHQSTLMTTIM